MVEMKTVVFFVTLFAWFINVSKGKPSYIIAESDGGLSNRLRSLISHMYIGKILHNEAHLVMIWDINDACPGHFLQIFKPLENVTFISNSSRELYAQNAVKIYPNSRDGFERTLLNHDVNFVVKKRLWWNIELTYWERILWIREVEERVELFARQHSVCNMTAMHIRRTDMDLELNPKKRSGYDHYFRWVESQPPLEPVYLMTDNPGTQQLFLDKYGTSKILVYANISAVDGGGIEGSSAPLQHSQSTAPASSPKKLAIDHRFTTLEHTIVDVLVAAHARDLRPAPFSSVSDFVRMMNFLHRWKWCGCTFRGC